MRAVSVDRTRHQRRVSPVSCVAAVLLLSLASSAWADTSGAEALSEAEKYGVEGWYDKTFLGDCEFCESYLTAKLAVCDAAGPGHHDCEHLDQVQDCQRGCAVHAARTGSTVAQECPAGGALFGHGSVLGWGLDRFGQFKNTDPTSRCWKLHRSLYSWGSLRDAHSTGCFTLDDDRCNIEQVCDAAFDATNIIQVMSNLVFDYPANGGAEPDGTFTLRNRRHEEAMVLKAVLSNVGTDRVKKTKQGTRTIATMKATVPELKAMCKEALPDFMKLQALTLTSNPCQTMKFSSRSDPPTQFAVNKCEMAMDMVLLFRRLQVSVDLLGADGLNPNLVSVATSRSGSWATGRIKYPESACFKARCPAKNLCAVFTANFKYNGGTVGGMRACGLGTVPQGWEVVGYNSCGEPARPFNAEANAVVQGIKEEYTGKPGYERMSQEPIIVPSQVRDDVSSSGSVMSTSQAGYAEAPLQANLAARALRQRVRTMQTSFSTDDLMGLRAKHPSAAIPEFDSMHVDPVGRVARTTDDDESAARKRFEEHVSTYGMEASSPAMREKWRLDSLRSGTKALNRNAAHDDEYARGIPDTPLPVLHTGDSTVDKIWDELLGEIGGDQHHADSAAVDSWKAMREMNPKSPAFKSLRDKWRKALDKMIGHGFIPLLDRNERLYYEHLPEEIRSKLTYYQSSFGRLAVKSSPLAQITAHCGTKFSARDPSKVGEMLKYLKEHRVSVDDIRGWVAYQEEHRDAGRSKTELLMDFLNSAFVSYNAFFYRKLNYNSRVIRTYGMSGAVVSAADSRVLVFDNIDDSLSFWIKGQDFNLGRLLSNTELGGYYSGGSMVIFRLAPQDYHRFHIPIDTLIGPSYPYDGGYYSVSPIAVHSPIDVFTDNKRVHTDLMSDFFGRVAYIAIGATCVGSVVLTSKEGTYAIPGAEHGYMAFGGSTVVVLFKKGAVEWSPNLLRYSAVPVETIMKMGDFMGVCNPEPANNQPDELARAGRCRLMGRTSTQSNIRLNDFAVPEHYEEYKGMEFEEILRASPENMFYWDSMDPAAGSWKPEAARVEDPVPLDDDALNAVAKKKAAEYAAAIKSEVLSKFPIIGLGNPSGAADGRAALLRRAGSTDSDYSMYSDGTDSDASIDEDSPDETPMLRNRGGSSDDGSDEFEHSYSDALGDLGQFSGHPFM